MLTPEQRRQKLGDVVRVAGGNFLEMYDFFVFGYFAIHIANNAFSFATAVFGGMTPAVCTYLIHETGNPMPGAWLSVAAALALASTLVAQSFVPSPAGREAVA
jgi:hypothetical protein